MDDSVYEIMWRPMAETDLESIIDYIAKDNPIKTTGFGHELRAKVHPLAQHPKLGRTGRPGLPAYVRELAIHQRYIVFYRVLAESQIIEILRVKHASQKIL